MTWCEENDVDYVFGLPDLANLGIGREARARMRLSRESG